MTRNKLHFFGLTHQNHMHYDALTAALSGDRS